MKLAALRMLIQEFSDLPGDTDITRPGPDHTYEVAFAEIREAVKENRHTYSEPDPSANTATTKILVVY